MNKEQENYMSMVLTVFAMLTAEAGIVSAMAAFQTMYDELEAEIAVEAAYQMIQETGITGWATKKGDKKDEMIADTLKVANGVGAYALVQNDPVLAEEVNYTKSKLEKMRDTEVDVACKLVHTKASPIIVALADYGLLPADLTKLNSSVGLYKALQTMPNEKGDEKQVATKGIEDSIGRIRGIFKKMDKVVKTMTDTEADFVTKYFNSREIYDIGVRHEKEVPPVTP